MNRNFHRWFFLFLGLCAIFSVASLFFRFRVEERNKAVGLCYEMQVLKDLAAASHQPILKVLQNAKFHGLTGVTLSEETLDDLLRADVIQFKGEKKIAGKLSAHAVKLKLTNVYCSVQHRSLMNSYKEIIIDGFLTLPII